MIGNDIVIDIEKTGNRLRNIAIKKGYEVKDIQRGASRIAAIHVQ